MIFLFRMFLHFPALSKIPCLICYFYKNIIGHHITIIYIYIYIYICIYKNSVAKFEVVHVLKNVKVKVFLYFSAIFKLPS